MSTTTEEAHPVQKDDNPSTCRQLGTKSRRTEDGDFRSGTHTLFFCLFGQETGLGLNEQMKPIYLNIKSTFIMGIPYNVYLACTCHSSVWFVYLNNIDSIYRRSTEGRSLSFPSVHSNLDGQ